MAASLELQKKQAGLRAKRAILIGLSIITLSGVIGIAIDLMQLYVRRSELLHMADTAATAGARQLNGEVSGLTAALIAAMTVAEAGNSPIVLSEEQISFGPTPNGPWSRLAKARAHPGEQQFIRVEAGAAFRQRHSAWLMPQLDPSPISSAASGVAVAGRTDPSAFPGDDPKISIYH